MKLLARVVNASRGVFRAVFSIQSVFGASAILGGVFGAGQRDPVKLDRKRRV